MSFEPIAIVGQGCALPGALDPADLWDGVLHRRVGIEEVRPDDWRLPAGWASPVPMVSGLVRGFDQVFDPRGLTVSEDEARAWDPALKWLVHAGRAALRGAGRDAAEDARRAGLVVGNLGYPSRLLSAFAERVWQAGLPERDRLIPELVPPDAAHRFCSALPVTAAARALGLDCDALALDAACASSLYAVKLACDRLHDRTADLMLAGGLSGADGLLIHLGFDALAALSRTGRSRPFHREADGLVPAEGAALVALMRLDDALRGGRELLGVIRGIGLANDGAAGGFLTPAQAGQERAMRAAYRSSGVDPATVSLLECHATGTPVGDAVELRSAAAVFGNRRDELAIGSSKGNFGHLLTASGAAGLLKVLGALRAGIRPASAGSDVPIPVGDGLRLLHENEAWEESDGGPRRAAVSSFGFGGNNAHLVVDGPEGYGARRRGRNVSLPRARAEQQDARPACTPDIAIVAMGARVGTGESLADLRDALFTGTTPGAARSTIGLAVEGLRFPPKDLAVAAAQALVLEAAREAVAGVSLPRDSMVLVGMGCGPEAARAPAGTRYSAWAEHHGVADRADFGAEFSAERGIGAMANIFANRIGVQLDLTGPAFAVCAEEASGPEALALAARALRTREVGAAVVGAVDLSAESVHAAAVPAGRVPGDAAVVMVLKRLDDARRDGDAVLATLEECTRSADASSSHEVAGLGADISVGDGREVDPTAVFGSAHAAQGLVEVACAVLALRHRARFRAGRPADPAMAAETAEVVTRVLGARPVRTRLRAAERAPGTTGAVPVVRVYSGGDAAEAIAALEARRESNAGPARLAVLVDASVPTSARAEAARQWLLGTGLRPAGMAFRAAPIAGDVAFVFTNGSAAAPRMGRELLLAFPSLVDAVAARYGNLAELADWAYRGDGRRGGALDQIEGVTVLAAVQAAVTRDVLGISPAAAVGYSSGESTALLVMGAWTHPRGMDARFRASDLYSRDVGGELRAVRRAWAAAGVSGERWTTYVVDADADRVRAVLAGEAAVHLMTVNSPDTCVLGGEAEACAGVLRRLGDPVAIAIDYDLAAHAPEVAEVRDEWYDLHLLPAAPVPGVRFYSGATGEPYEPGPERVARAMTEQALGTIDFVALIERAYADGARVFVEHGPAGLCTGWIKRILRDRDHVAVALDGRPGDSLTGLLHAVAELAAAGASLDVAALSALLEPAPLTPVPGRLLSITAHATPVRVTDLPKEVAMAPAPRLTDVENSGHRTTTSAPQPDAAPPGVLLPPQPGVLQPTTAPPADNAGLLAGNAGVLTGNPGLLAGHAGLLALAAAQHQLVSGAHRLHLALQSEAQVRFLAHQERLTAHLVQTGPASPPPPPASLTAVVSHAEPPVTAHPEAAVHAHVPKPGPKFDRTQLEHLAHGRISDLFGPLFAVQDEDVRQTRMPTPPMLLADRVTGVDAEPGSMGTGRIWTETDVRADGWYLDHTGRMPAGLLMESGQADLLLISWLGVDLGNRGERVYRLLGCEATFHAPSPRAGTTLDYEIRVLDHAEHAGQRLFFFEYDCRADGRPQLTVRGGQAGFFTDAELASTGGVLWDPTGPSPEGAADPVPIAADRAKFTAEEVRAFAEGRPADCFGAAWTATRAHIRTPRIADGQMLLLHEVSEFDSSGGPWGRGYLRAETAVRPEDWFFDGHFHNDPCMPGTLMFDGCMQAMSFYLAAAGFTVNRDAWRFEPVPEEAYRMRCRGQVTPGSRRMVYEVFVSGLSAGPFPTLHADVLVTVDGIKALYVERLGVRLVPDWPLEHWRTLGPARTQTTGAPVPLPWLGGLVGHQDAAPVARIGELPTGYASLLDCAWGRISDGLGPVARRFDGGLLRGLRLPGPPYHFMTRVGEVSGPYDGFQVGSSVVAEYDVPDEAWFFAENPSGGMPLCVLMEIALQPCGWLGAYVGSMLRSDTEVLFRNLDGDVTVTADVRPSARTIRTRAELVSVSQFNDMIIETFDIRCDVDGAPLLAGTTVFGFFSTTALAEQVGIPPTDDERTRLTEPGNTRTPLNRPGMPGPMLLMADRITDFLPTGGSSGLGRIRAEKSVDADEWFFKAHFFQDPVMPGSLGVEAITQVIQWYMLETGLADGLPGPAFEAVPLHEPARWKYRGQVVPTDVLVTIEADILEVAETPDTRTAYAEAWLWVDGRRIYHLPRHGVRVRSGA